MTWSILMLAMTPLQISTPPTSGHATPPIPVPDYLKRAGVPQYPPKAYRDGLTGTAMVEMRVDVRGRITGCKVSSSSGSDELDDASCAYARNIRFQPARDSEGQVIPGLVTYPVRWDLPNGGKHENTQGE